MNFLFESILKVRARERALSSYKWTKMLSNTKTSRQPARSFTEMAPNNASRALVAALLAAGCAALASSATTHTVGGVHSWMTGVDYAAWASDKTFVVGDQLCEQSPDDYIRHSYVCCCVCCSLSRMIHYY